MQRREQKELFKGFLLHFQLFAENEIYPDLQKHKFIRKKALPSNQR